MYCKTILFAVVAAAAMSVTSAKLSGRKSAIDFLVLGDWGHNVPASQAQNGVDFQQQKVADAMGVYAGVIKPSFLLAIGDNFYFYGVNGTQDPLWTTAYTNVYTASSLFIPWYPIMGNHDYPYPQSEIDFYKESRDTRWTFPDYQYTKKWTIPNSGGKTLEIVFVNTVALCPEVLTTALGWPTTEPAISYVWQPTRQWIENALNASTADYLFVSGHYNIYSNSATQNGALTPEYQCLSKRLDPLMQQYGVSVYMNGHVHNFEHNFINNINYLTIGHGCDLTSPLMNNTPPGLLYQKNVAGFGHLSVGRSGVKVNFVDDKGTVIYSSNINYSGRRLAKKN